MIIPSNDGGAAFPSLSKLVVNSGGFLSFTYEGMSLRDYLAGQALICVRASGLATENTAIAEACYQLADAMLAARVKAPTS